MKNRLKHWFFPHEENQYRPHLLQKTGIAIILVLILATFSLSNIQRIALFIDDGDFAAAVLPGVLVDLANADRQSEALPALERSEVLERAAQMKADHMADNSYFAHTSPEGITPWYWFRQVGYNYTVAGENLAVHFTDSRAVERAWMNSPGHRANILNDRFTQIGIATARGEFEGYETTFVVQMFGAPRNLSAQTVNLAQSDTEPETIEVEIIEEEEVAQTNPVLGAEESADELKSGNDQSQVAVTSQETEQPRSRSSFLAQEQAGEAVSEQNPDESQELAQATDAMDGEQAVPDETATGSPVANEISGDRQNQASLWEHLVTQPYTLINIIYIGLAILILLSILASIVVEFHRHDAEGVIYGIILLLLLFSLLYLNRTLFLPEVMIA